MGPLGCYGSGEKGCLFSGNWGALVIFKGSWGSKLSNFRDLRSPAKK